MKYRAFAYSSIGDNHRKQNKICQDYSLYYQDNRITIAAVADGHGSTAHYRSDRGARFACESAVKCIKTFCQSGAKVSSDKIILSIVGEWEKRVMKDWNTAFRADTPYLQNPRHVYGTTLIAVAATKNFWFGLQIGDGRCVTFCKDGSAAQPIPWDKDCYLNVTTSLCDTDASHRFRYFYSKKMPSAVFIGTDGVDNSYPVYENETHLAALYQTIAQNFTREGFDQGSKQLEEFLPVLTKKGSGDDVSIAGFINMEEPYGQRSTVFD
jgi:hypothetical protein